MNTIDPNGDAGRALQTAASWLDEHYGHRLNRTEVATATRGVLEAAWPHVTLAVLELFIGELLKSDDESLAKVRREMQLMLQEERDRNGEDEGGAGNDGRPAVREPAAESEGAEASPAGAPGEAAGAGAG